MKKYAYKFVKMEKDFQLNMDKKIKAMEKEWNELGAQGWKFCTQVGDRAVFRKKYKDKDGEED